MPKNTKLICVEITFKKTFYVEVPEEFPEDYIGETECVEDEKNSLHGDVDAEREYFSHFKVSKSEACPDLTVMQLDDGEADEIIAFAKS